MRLPVRGPLVLFLAVGLLAAACADDSSDTFPVDSTSTTSTTTTSTTTTSTL
ncbi:MAG: hypothetical protein GWN73_33050, partial [Actinobacteria bacterium]|nr:hypothetical protein [Actinomycetota bacterium]NIT98004.1 hypothetical protein [Actinomycetota bacterium]NIU69954.1 hypothetical protein [Actinomycetota bacterium]NIW31827.1 hypothetical protein [Actinomycetota bacterium]NIX52983.1 hypothetical protein [Actinomycetota bacterium]